MKNLLIKWKDRKLFWFMAAAVLLTTIGFYVNRYISIRALYADDLYLWSYYGEDSFLKFTFPEHTKANFRPVYWAVSYLWFKMIGYHVNWYSLFNTGLNVGIAWVLYLFGLRLTRGHQGISIAIPSLFLISHLAYYQIGQVLGLMESMALLFAISILWFLFEYIDDSLNTPKTVANGPGRGRRQQFLKDQSPEDCNYLGACFFFFLLIFTHERFIALTPLFYLALFSKPVQKSRKALLAKMILPLLELGVFFAARVMVAGQAMPAGTAGTEVTDTFSLLQSIGYAFQQVAYIFGMNVGPAYLSGVNILECPVWMILLVMIGAVLCVLMTVLYFSVCRQNFRMDRRFWGINLLFIMFIGLCIGASSITVRLEMRWIYVSYTAALLFLGFMAGELRDMEEHKKGCKTEESRRIFRKYMPYLVFVLLFSVFAVTKLPVEKYYRSKLENVYFWTDLDRMNSLADQTIGRYGREMLGKRQVYIFYNTYKMTDFYAEYFFKPFDPEKTGQGTRIHFVQDLQDLPKNINSENCVILFESEATRGYMNVNDQFFAG